MLGERIGNPTVGFLIAAMIAQSVSLYSGFVLAIAWQYRWLPSRQVEFDNG